MKKILIRCFIVVFSAVFIFGASWGVAAEKTWTNISTPELKKRMDSGEQINLICVLPRSLTGEGPKKTQGGRQKQPAGSV